MNVMLAIDDESINHIVGDLNLTQSDLKIQEI